MASPAWSGSAGDVLEVREYERLAPLAAARRALPSIQAARRGDCLVAFSRRDVHSIKRQVEAGARHSCCVVRFPLLLIRWCTQPIGERVCAYS